MPFVCERCGKPITNPSDGVINDEGIFHKWCLRKNEEAEPLTTILVELASRILDNDTVTFYYDLYYIGL